MCWDLLEICKRDWSESWLTMACRHNWTYSSRNLSKALARVSPMASVTLSTSGRGPGLGGPRRLPLIPTTSSSAKPNISLCMPGVPTLTDGGPRGCEDERASRRRGCELASLRSSCSTALLLSDCMTASNMEDMMMRACCVVDMWQRKSGEMSDVVGFAAKFYVRLAVLIDDMEKHNRC